METNVRKLSSVCVLRFVTLNNRDTRQEEVDLSGLGTPPGQTGDFSLQPCNRGAG